jgi:hypothetical protein
VNEIQTLNRINARLVNVYLEADTALYRKLYQNPARGKEAVHIFDFMLSRMERFLISIKEE